MQVFTQAARAQVSAALIDELDTGIIVCTADGTIVLDNWAARLDMQAQCGIRAREGVLEGMRGTALGAAMARAAGQGRRSLVTLGSAGRQLFATVSPLRTHDGRPLMLLLLGRSTVSSRLSLELFTSAFGLSRAEHKVLAGLIDHKRPKEIAAEHGVELSTVKTQVQAIHQKLGVSTNVETVALVAALPQLAGALRVLVLPPQEANSHSESFDPRGVQAA